VYDYDFLTLFFVVDVLVLRVRDVHGDFALVGRGPLEEETERDVVGVRRELPEERRTVFVCRNADRHCLTMSDLESIKIWIYRVRHGFRLTKEEDYFWVSLNHFFEAAIFDIENWFAPKT